MPNKNNKYFYIDLDLAKMKVIGWGTESTASLTGNTNDPKVHRIFLTKGQFNKLKKKLDTL